MFTATASAVRSTTALSVCVAILFILGCSFVATSQVATGQQLPQTKGPQIKVIGRVVEEGTQKGLKSASIYMKHLGDGSVTGDLTDNEGRFSVNNAKPGKYHFAVSLLGYAKFKDTLVIDAAKTSFEAGTITLPVSSTKMNEVSVSGEREVMEISAEKKVFNVAKDATVTGGTAVDALRQVPTVDVDVNGNVSVRGSSNLVLQVNGKQTGFAGSDRASLLQQIPANMIDKIEVITNPSARYDAEGMGGIINIVLKSEITSSWNLNVNGGAGTNHKYNLGADFGLKNGPLSLSAGYGARYHNQWFGAEIESNQLFGARDIVEQAINGTWSGLGHFGNFNADYAFSTTSTLNLNGQVRFNDGQNTEDWDYAFRHSNNEIFQRANRDNITKRHWKSYEAGLGFKQLFSSKQHYLDVSTRFSNNDQSSFGNFTQRELDVNGAPTQATETVQNNNFINNFKIWTVQADYVTMSPIGKVETGAKSTLRMIDNDTYLDSLNRRTGEYIPNRNAINRFYFSDHVLAAYGMLGTRLLDFNIQAGLRVEHTLVNTHQITTNERNGMNYTHLFPTLHLSRKLDTANTLQISYSRRINRPNFWQLNPFIDYSNPSALRKGNPNLMPETIDAAEVSFVSQLDKHTITATAYYRQTNNAMQFFALVDTTLPTGANTVLTFRNFDIVQNTGFEFVYRGQILPWWTAMANVNVFYNSVQGGSEVDNISAGAIAYNVRANSTVKMPWEGGNLQVNYMYNGPIQFGQGTMQAWHALTLGFRQDLSKEFSLTFNVSDVFDTQRFNMLLQGTSFTANANQKPETRIATLNFSYRLGGIQGEQPRRRRDSGDTPQDNGGGGFGF
jgi:outer membrane receptor protein involved in Fe transport